MTRHHNALLACLRNAVAERTFWTPVATPEERRAAYGLRDLGLVVIERDIPQKCLWIAPTRGCMRRFAEFDADLGEVGAVKSPWRITSEAARKYGAMAHETDIEQVEDALVATAIDATTSQHTPRELDNGSIQYRGPKPLRLRLIVVPPDRRSDSELPALVDVLSAHKGPP
jgi:hypothetical protein